MMIFDLFMFLWTTEFIQAIGIMVIGGTVSHWYFATSDGSVKPDPSHHGQSGHQVLSLLLVKATRREQSTAP